MHIRFNSLRSFQRRSSYAFVLALIASGCSTSVALEDEAIDGVGADGSNSEGDRVAEVDFAPGERVSEDFARGFLPDEWAGYAVGLPPPDVHYLYPLARAESGRLLVEPPDDASRELLRTLSAEAGPGAMLTFREGHAYLIAPERSDELHREVEAMLDRTFDEIGGNNGEHGQDEDSSSGVGVSAQPLIIGTDNRVRMALVDNVPANDIRASIGYVETFRMSPNDAEGCTGTVVSPQQTYLGDQVRAVLTAAHCVVRSGEAPTGDDVFVPRADGVAANVTAPFGVFTYNTAFVTPDYAMSSCASNPEQQMCAQHDWAVVLYDVPSAPAMTLKHYMRYRRVALSQLMAYERLKIRGYPSCVGPDAPPTPPACRDRTLYGSTAPCHFVATPTSFGEALFHDCDQNKGMSGSAIYTYLAQRPTIVAVNNSQITGGGAPPAAPFNGEANLAAPVHEDMEYFLDQLQSLPP